MRHAALLGCVVFVTFTVGPGPAHPQARPGLAPSPGYAICNGSARQRALRGADRRRFVTRCRLGYETPVFKP